MTLTRWHRPELSWSPFRQLSSLRDEIDRLFEAPLSSLTELSQPFSGGWVPALDLYEDKDNYVVKMELPGMSKEGIDISLHDGVLSVSGERKDEQKHEDGETYRSERFFGRFQRSITLPASVDGSKVNASYQDGILTITLPKAEEAKPKQITINEK
jgi:HSP20 family protein